MIRWEHSPTSHHTQPNHTTPSAKNLPEQYARRYSVIVKGLERAPGFERHDSLVEEVKKIVESSNSVPFTEVDKLHRNGPRNDNIGDGRR